MIRPIIFGKFCLLERISVGGMAEIYRAKLVNAPHFNRFLVVKRILPNLAADNEFITMFIDEAKITVELNHPNICQIYELGRLEDAHYIVMEYIPGRDLLGLQNRYRRQKKIMSVSQACFITAQVAQGLDYAHRAVDSEGRALHLIHRDVSPQNVLISFEGLIKLIDFGVAKAASKNSKTQAGVLKGKFGYMSPEQVSGEGEVDHRSDIFALGTVFWELLTGRRLFHADNEFATLELVRECDVRPPSELNRLVPPQIEACVMRALCPDPAYRYQWAGEFARDLWMFLNSCNPPYTQWHLQNWMCTNFAEDLEKEWEKLPIFQQINTIDDVKMYNDRLAAEAEAKMREQMASFIAAPVQQTYDFEGNVVPELTDMTDNTGGSTQVFTPEFDFGAVEDLPGDDTNPAILPAPGAQVQPGMPPRNTAKFDEGDMDFDAPVAETPPPENPLHMSVYQMDALVMPMEPASNRTTIILSTLIILILWGGGGFGAYWYFVLRVPVTVAETSVPVATVSIEVKPNSPGIIATLISQPNNQVVANGIGSKLEFGDLEPGKYVLEVEHPNFETEKRELNLGDGMSTVKIDMLTPKTKTVRMTLNLIPAEAAIYANGELFEGSGAERKLDLDAETEYELEVKAPGYQSFVTSVTLREDTPQSLDVKLEKGVATVQVKSSPPAELWLENNGEWEKVGKTPKTITDLDPTMVYRVEVRAKGYKTWSKEISFDDQFDKSYLAPLNKE